MRNEFASKYKPITMVSNGEISLGDMQASNAHSFSISLDCSHARYLVNVLHYLLSNSTHCKHVSCCTVFIFANRGSDIMRSPQIFKITGKVPPNITGVWIIITWVRIMMAVSLYYFVHLTINCIICHVSSIISNNWHQPLNCSLYNALSP